MRVPTMPTEPIEPTEQQTPILERPMTSDATKPLLHNRKYVFLMSAQAVSNLGDWLYILALFVLVGFRWHASPIVISLMMLCLAAPMVVLGPFTGMLADRWNRTVLMIISNLVMAGLIGVIPWLPSRWMLFVILLLVGAFESLFGPAESGKLKEIVPDQHMRQATSFNSSIMQLAKILGPGISGFVVGALGSMSAFWLDSASFMLSIIFLLLTGFRAITLAQRDAAVPVPPAANAVASVSTPATANGEATTRAPGEALVESTTAKQRFMEGLNHIRNVRILWVGTLILTVALLIIQLTDAQIVTLIRLIPGASSKLMGLIMGMSGAGGLMAALLVGFVKWKSTSRMMAIGCVGIGTGLGVSAFLVAHAKSIAHLSLPWLFAISVLSISIGMCASLIFIPFQATAQQNTPADLTGRVFGTIGSLTTAAALLGPAIGGVLVTAIGIIAAYAISAIALLAMGIAALVGQRWLEPHPKITGPTTNQNAL